jgi:RNA polymerase-binding transcription factor DksA
MSREQRKGQAMMTAERAAGPGGRRASGRGTGGPRWRAVLEARWQARVREVTELSLAYHVAAAPDAAGGGDDRPETQALLRRTVAARRKLADVEEALGRLAAGRFGSCEQCGGPIPAGQLAAAPETRYCPRCDPETAQNLAVAGRAPR